MLNNKFAQLEATSGADDELEALKRKMGLVVDEAPAVEARVDATEEEEMTADEMAELEEALEGLKQREMGG